MTQAETNNQSSAITSAEFGHKLAQQRQQKGLSIGEVSQQLKLPVRQIEALEQGNYETLPEPVFIRGFLRSYARFLDLDENYIDRYLTDWQPLNQAYQVKDHHGVNYTNSIIKRPFPTWILGVLAVGIIGYGIYAWQNKSQSEHAKQEAGSSAIRNTEINPPAHLNNTNVLVKPMSSSEVAINQIASSIATGTGELVINTRYRTMLTVTNANGEVLINQIVPGRSEYRFSEGAPFEVRLGYAIGSSATFDGIAIDIEKARTSGKTAVFTASKDTIQSIALTTASTPASATP